MSTWFYARGPEKVGPLGLSELRRLAQLGELRPSDMILQEGATHWVRAGSVDGLFSPAQPTTDHVPADRPAEVTVAESAARRHDPDLPDVPGYELLEELGRGGMGVVYKARQKGLNRLVALKMILAGSHADMAERARFQTEAEAVARLQHPNIVQVHAVGEHDGLPYFSLEYCDSGSLDRAIAGTPQEPRTAAALVETLARAVHHAHQHGIIHRDLKPANILLQNPKADEPQPCSAGTGTVPVSDFGFRISDLTPKVTDFGLARKLDDEAGQTRSGAVLGTPSYMAPEQARGQTHDLGPLVDVHALGAILYECLTGRPPFKGATGVETVRLVIDTEPVAPRQLAPGVPRDLETICLKCLHKEPARRYASAQELAEDLKRHRDGEPIHARPVSRAERVWRWARRNPALASLAVLLTLAVTVGGSGITWKWHEAVEQRGLAEDRADDLQREKDEVERQRHIIEKREREANRFVYATLMNQLPDVLERGDLLTAQRYLERFAPGPGRKEEDDPRGYEWHHYWGLVRAGRKLLAGHADTVVTLAFSDDETLLASGSRDTTVRLWDVASGESRGTITLTSIPTDLAFLPGGKHLAVASGWYVLQVWDAESRQKIAERGGIKPVCVAVVPGADALAVGDEDGSIRFYDRRLEPLAVALTPAHRGRVTSLACSGDGKLLVSGGVDARVNVWDIASLKPGGTRRIASLTGHRAEIHGVDIRRNGNQLASASADGSVRLWRLDRQAVLTMEPVVFEGHRQAVRSIAFSSDRELLLTAGQDGTVRLWETGALAAGTVLRGHARGVRVVRASRSGRAFASGGEDTTVKLWDLSAVRRTAGEKPAPRGALALAFSPGGDVLASGGEDGVRFWDVRSGRELARTRVSVGPVLSLAYTTDGKAVVAATGERLFQFFRASDGKPLEVFLARERVRRVAISPDGRLLAGGTEDGSLLLHDRHTGREVAVARMHHDHISRLAFSPDSKLLAASSVDYTLSVLDVKAKRQVAWLQGHQGPVAAVAFTPDGRLVSGGADGTLRLWEGERFRRSRVLGASASRLIALAVSPDGRTIYRAGNYSEAGKLEARDMDEGSERPVLLASHGHVRDLALSADGTLLAMAAADGTISVCEAKGKFRVRLPGHVRAVTALAASPDGRLIARAGADFSIRLIEARSEREQAILAGHAHVVSAVAFSPDGRLLASAAHDASVRLWEVAEGKERAVWRGFDHPILTLAFSPDGSTLAAGGGAIDQPGELKLWDVKAGKPRRTLAPPRRMVRAVAFARGGSVLVSAGGDGWVLPGEVRLWEAATGELLEERQAHRDAVTAITVTPDGGTLATAGRDRVIHLWSLDGPKARRHLRELSGHRGLVHSLAFAPDGRTLLSAGEDGLRFWQTAEGQSLGAPRQRAPPRVLAFAADDTLLVGDEDGRLTVHRRLDPEPAAEQYPRPAGSPGLDLDRESERLQASARRKAALFLIERDERERGLALLHDTDSLLEHLQARAPHEDVARERVATLAALAEATDQDRPAEVEKYCRQALQIVKQSLDRSPDPGDRFTEARVRASLAGALGRLRRGPEVREEYLAALLLMMDLQREQPANRDYFRVAGRCRKALGDLLLGDGEPGAAREAYRQAAVDLAELARDGPEADRFRAELAEVLEQMLQPRMPAPGRLFLARHLVTVRLQRIAVADDGVRRFEDLSRAYESLARTVEVDNPADAGGPYRRAAGARASCAALATAEARKKHEDAAMQLLDIAVQRGYKDVTDLATAAELAPLRQREDFRRLLEKLRESPGGQ